MTYLAINPIKRRLRDAFSEDVQFEEIGWLTDFEIAKRLADMDKWQCRQWALSIIYTMRGGKHGWTPAICANGTLPLSCCSGTD